MDREAFLKSQLEAVQKAITKQEVPLKPKHARSLILGTHREKSSNVFWNSVMRMQLEKNPVLTWKFCHILHKLIRDGHRKVPEESHRYLNRIKQLSQFWHHLHTSGYGVCNEMYCKLLVDRIEFHRKLPAMPGNLSLNESQLKALQGDVDTAYEASIEMLDQMDNLLSLQEKVFNSLEMLSWSSMVPQGQTLLAPLILVILDSSKFYDFLVKIIFHLHAQLPPDTLAGHRERFKDVFRRTKKFFEEAGNLQYFKFLVSIPSLPATAPNFLQASDLESYRTPHVHVYNESEDGGSVAGDSELVHLEERPLHTSSPSSLPDQRDEQITSLSRALEDERFAKERLIAEARSRIEQYENRLVQMQNEIDHARHEADDQKGDVDRLRAELATRELSLAERSDARVVDAEARSKQSEEKFLKLKGVYEKFRAEHLAALQKLADLQRQMEGSEQERIDRDERMNSIQRRLEQAEKQSSDYHSKLESATGMEDELRSQLAQADAQAELIRNELEAARNAAATAEKEREAVRLSLLSMFDRCSEELQNATSITYPPHLAMSALAWAAECLSRGPLPLAGHALSTVLVIAASAAYTASIQHFDDVNEECKRVLAAARSAVSSCPSSADPSLPSLSTLQQLIGALPVQSDIDKEVVGIELEEEMKRMGAAIKQAVDMIEDIQRKARENTQGIRLEVNEKILETCQALMSAIMVLVARSRELQLEIVAAGRGQGPPNEFYKRNHQWTEGLLSAAKAVGVAARVLVASADGVVSGQGKFEHLIVAAQEIAASTAQLFVSSRVKAEPGSEKMSALSVASRSVNQATAQVVATVKSGRTTLNEKDAFDFSHLTLHDAKKEEMESQVRCLELEQSLVRERARLAELRKRHYHVGALVSETDQNGGGNSARDADSSFEVVG